MKRKSLQEYINRQSILMRLFMYILYLLISTTIIYLLILSINNDVKETNFLEGAFFNAAMSFTTFFFNGGKQK
ncbi:hypothetical protein [Psychrobacter sp. I-STPA10]|uniref:hypothetical protein n=1 Tax=Psychrobacter sp. I-STPA10 TaxID=2585769 RepID=UPI001E6274A8|nr:hypothetical protein [Psychrobacter sp. I-STPA10]